MPTMLRIPGKALKIATKVLGLAKVPKKRSVSPRGDKIEQRLKFEETVRIR